MSDQARDEITGERPTNHRAIPSVDEVLRRDDGRVLAQTFGRDATVSAVRSAIAEIRPTVLASAADRDRSDVAASVVERADGLLRASSAPRLRRVYNLTGTVLHTNLGRAVLAEAAVDAATDAMRHAVTLEAEVETGRRGERDDAVRDHLRALTGGEDALVVNNNAAAVLLVLNTFAAGRETIVSRGELIEIGGSFRMPDIMASAGTRLIEVGTTNRTHARDYERAIGPETGLLLKVHTSNYVIQGFTAEVSPPELARIGRERGVPVVDDLGSGTLIDLSAYGLSPERTVREAIADGADLVTFSGDKLLGGPQAGLIVGRADLIARCATNPMKRALRLDKIRMAALEATLALYRRPETLAESLPVLALLTRPVSEIAELARSLVPDIGAALGPSWRVEAVPCDSQIGSGALPLTTIPSHGVTIQGNAGAALGGRALDALAAAFRGLPVPVFGRVVSGGYVMDMRCLPDISEFRCQLRFLPGDLC